MCTSWVPNSTTNLMIHNEHLGSNYVITSLNHVRIAQLRFVG